VGVEIDVQMTLGGTLAAEHLADLVEAAYADGLRPDWDAAPLDVADLADHPAGEPLTLCGRRGLGDELPAFCQRHGLAYRFAADGDSEGGGIVRVFTGSGAEREYLAGGVGDDRALLGADTFATLPTREAVAAWFEAANAQPPAFTVGPPTPANDAAASPDLEFMLGIVAAHFPGLRV